MKLARRAALFLISLVFGFFLFMLVTSASLSLTIGKPGTLKRWLSSSGIYGKVVPAVLEESAKASKEPSDTSSISLSDPNIQKIAENVFTPTFIQQSSESAIDGTYTWLEGKTDKPQFNINVADAKAKFANGVGDYLRTRAASLPACKTIPTQFDVLNATCIPRGLNVNSEIDKTVKDILNNKDFLPDPAVTADSIKTKEDGQEKPLYQTNNKLPQAYKWLHIAPYILGVLVLLAGVGIIMLNEHHRKGLQKVMVSLFTTGGLLLLYTWLLSYGFSKAQTQLTKDHDGTKVTALKESAIDAVKLAQHDINRIVIIFGLVFIAIGLGLGVYLLLTRGKAPKTSSAATGTKEETHFKKPESSEPEKATEQKKSE